MPETLQPGRYFVAHAYKDQREIAKLKAAVPNEVRLFIFEPIKARPDELVSNPILDKIVHVTA